MKYLLNVFSPETHPELTASDRIVSGFRVRHRQADERLIPGDLMVRIVCCLARLSRWVGPLEEAGAPFEDATPLFVEQDDPFAVRIIRELADVKHLEHLSDSVLPEYEESALA